jgi:hypothetical protein
MVGQGVGSRVGTLDAWQFLRCDRMMLARSCSERDSGRARTKNVIPSRDRTRTTESSSAKAYHHPEDKAFHSNFEGVKMGIMEGSKRKTHRI